MPAVGAGKRPTSFRDSWHRASKRAATRWVQCPTSINPMHPTPNPTGATQMAMNPQDPSMSDPSMGADPGGMGADDGSAGYTVCITVSTDGSYTVGEEGEAMAPASDLKDALTQAMQLLKTNGGAEESSENDSFSSGFSGPIPRKGMGGGKTSNMAGGTSSASGAY